MNFVVVIEFGAILATHVRSGITLCHNSTSTNVMNGLKIKRFFNVINIIRISVVQKQQFIMSIY